jgi:hypothetical protein
MITHLRNIAIVLILAALVAVVPGGGRGANFAIQAVSLAFLASIAWFASILYRQHRTDLYSLGNRRRALLYAALMVGTVTLTATGRMWSSSAGELAWLALIAASVYAIFAVVWSARRY